ncbi:hypothetical protein KJ855_02750, partial [Patescibacteria group bacterium]|nr:hypothetical protein [Patescibacteria group bacterium]
MIDNIHEDSHIPDSHIPEPKLRDFPAANKDVPLRVRKIGTFGENKIEENIVAQISKTTFDIPKKGFKVWERFADSTKRQENGEVLELTSDQKVDIFYGTYYKEIFSGKKYQPSECIADVTVGEDTRKVIAEDIKEKTYYFIQNSSRFQKVSQYYLYNRLAESMPAILLTMRDNLMTENDQIKYCQEKKSFLTKYVTGNALPHFLPANIAPEIIRGKEDELVNYSNFNAVITGYAEDIRNDNKESIRINNEIAQELLV